MNPRAAWVIGLLFACACPCVELRAEEPVAALARMVDLPTAKARRAAADALAAREDVTLEAWLAAARTFGRFAFAPAGPASERPRLAVGEAVEETPIWLQVPRGYSPDKPVRMLVVFHGTGQRGEDMRGWWAARAEAAGALLLAPSETGANGGYAFSARECAAAWAAIRWARRRFNVDEDRIVATGFSRGGHISWDLALRWPDRFAAIAPMIGGPRLAPERGHNNLRLLENIARMPIRDLQGSKDDPALLANLRLAFERLRALEAPDAKLIEFPELGHNLKIDAVDWKAWLGQVERDPRPKRVVRLAARADQARAFWVELTALDKKVEEALRIGIPARAFKTMSDAERRRYVQKRVDARTARLEVTMDAPGRFIAESERVRGFRLLLSREMLPDGGEVEVRWNGKRKRLRPRPSKRVLLREFAERFDRRFLPVAEVRLGR